MATSGTNHFELQTLNPKHQQVAALLAQGLGPGEIAPLVGFVPQYITMLTRDPLFKEYLSQMTEFAEAQLEAQFSRVPEVISEAFSAGTVDEKLKAARLQGELTGRLGKNERQVPNESSLERLNILAERLLALQANVREKGTVIDVKVSEG